ncbi:MAG: DUF2589 domain-containing protein [Flammeovirgaceae bacterium]
MSAEDNEFDFHGLQIESLISAPLHSIASANADLSKKQVEYILDICFSKSQDGDIYTPVLIPLTLTRSAIVEDHHKDDNPDPVKHHSMQFFMPLITLIPINNLSITKVNLDFGFELTHSRVNDDQKQEGDQTSSSGSNASKDSTIALHGYYSSHSSPKGQVSEKADTKDTTSEKETISMKVEIDTIPLSNGLKSLINYYSKAIYPTNEDQSNQ